jgi:hypothetical protein
LPQSHVTKRVIQIDSVVLFQKSNWMLCCHVDVQEQSAILSVHIRLAGFLSPLPSLLLAAVAAAAATAAAAAAATTRCCYTILPQLVVISKRQGGTTVTKAEESVVDP